MGRLHICSLCRIDSLHIVSSYFQPVITRGGLLSVHAFSSAGLLHIHVVYSHAIYSHAGRLPVQLPVLQRRWPSCFLGANVKNVAFLHIFSVNAPKWNHQSPPSLFVLQFVYSSE